MDRFQPALLLHWRRHIIVVTFIYYMTELSKPLWVLTTHLEQLDEAATGCPYHYHKIVLQTRDTKMRGRAPSAATEGGIASSRLTPIRPRKELSLIFDEPIDYYLKRSGLLSSGLH